MIAKRYDFDCITSDYLLGASLGREEVADGDYVLHSDYATIEDERDKLAQEVMRLVNINEQLHESHNALREAVARMFAAHETWAQKASASYLDWAEGRKNYDAARAAVDRLLTEEKP